MEEPGNDASADVDRHVALLAARLNDRVVEVSATVRDELEAKIPELRDDAATVELMGASVEGNIDTILHALHHEIPVDSITAPAAAIEYARRLAQHGVPVNALIRAYRLGQQRLTEMIFADLEIADTEPAARIAMMAAVTKTLFVYIDSVTQQVVAIYEDERERWVENEQSVRTVKVREVLADSSPVDLEALSVDLRYPLRWHHQALLVWEPGAEDRSDDLVGLQRFVRELSTLVGTHASPLFAPVDRSTAWVWLPFKSPPAAPVERIRQASACIAGAPRVAVGAVSAGIEGFRRSHQQACRAWELGSARAGSPSVIASQDPGVAVASLLAGNMNRLRDWVADVLGPLAVDSDNDARLRESLRVFLRAGSYKVAAEELNMHFNSVKYRMERAVERRGRPIGEDRLDVEVALLTCRWFGDAVLQPNR